MKLQTIGLMAFSALLVACNQTNHQECYQAKKAVAESTERFQQLEKERPLDASWWQAAMFEAVAWRSRACGDHSAASK
jgi:hypothetical protein